MERFNLDTWLKDKSRKVVTREGRPVRIVCWDSPNKGFPIVGFIDDNPTVFVWDKYGYALSGHRESNRDLFFADEEEKLTEFEKAVRNILARYISNIDCFPETIKDEAKSLLDLARKEIEKENPYNEKQKWTEEDSERLLRIHQFIWANRKGDTDEIYQQEQDADWLMTLNHQPKQEWSKEEFVSKKQYEEDLDKAYKNADKVQFNRGMDEVLNNPQKYFHVGDKIRPKNSNAEYTITSIYNGKYYGEGWSLDIMKAANYYELVEDCNEMNMTPQERECSNAHKKRMKRFTEKIGTVFDNDKM